MRCVSAVGSFPYKWSGGEVHMPSTAPCLGASEAGAEMLCFKGSRGRGLTFSRLSCHLDNTEHKNTDKYLSEQGLKKNHLSCFLTVEDKCGMLEDLVPRSWPNTAGVPYESLALEFLTCSMKRKTWVLKDESRKIVSR